MSFWPKWLVLSCSNMIRKTSRKLPPQFCLPFLLLILWPRRHLLRSWEVTQPEMPPSSFPLRKISAPRTSTSDTLPLSLPPSWWIIFFERFFNRFFFFFFSIVITLKDQKTPYQHPLCLSFRYSCQGHCTWQHLQARWRDHIWEHNA